MAVYTPVPFITGGYAWSAADHNAYIRDNFAVGVPDIFASKGDLAVGSGTNSALRLPISGDGTVLTTDSTAISGLSWQGRISNRQGGSSTDWDAAGTNNYNPGKIKIACGSAQWTGASANNGTYSFSLPLTFLGKPLILVTPQNTGVNGDIAITATVSSESSVQVKWRSVTATNYTVIPFSWVALGASS